MIRAFLEVLHDLWNFLLQAFRKKSTIHSDGTRSALAGPAIHGIDIWVEYGRVAYVKVDHLTCYSSSETGKKVKLATYLYGESVRVLRVENGKAEISKGLVHGWTDDDSLTTDPDEIFPSFEMLETYDEDSEATIRVRKCLKHHFKNIGSKYLEPEEYVLYRLMKDRVAIAWDNINSLLTKSWYQRLIGNRAVKLSEEPRTYSVMEYVNSQGQIKQGYVTAVYPDRTIMVESVGRENPGEFRLEELSHVEWVSWRPVFISFV